MQSTHWTRRRKRLRLLVPALIAFVAGAMVAAGQDGTPTPTPRAPDATPTPARETSVPLAQQVGRMVILRFAGTQAPGYVLRALRDGEAAGVILFRDNVVSPAQLKALTGSLVKASRDAPPLICVDQEGGEVRIVPWAGPESAAADQDVRADTREAGDDLRAEGINVTLAPVADVPSVDGAALAGRAFSRDPATAAEAVTDAIRGWHEGGVATTVKHFPGLGGATVNTDDGPSTISRTPEELQSDLEPFRAAIAADTEFVMASHATYPALDGLHIASQSPAIIDDLLRRELGFRGVVMTDSLEAAAVRAVADVEEAAIASVQAGVDVILTTGRGSYGRVYRALLARARSDPSFRARVHASAARVLAAQSSLHG